MSMPPVSSESEGNQILVPESFLMIHLEPGRLKPTLGQRALHARYELCEDLANMLTEPTANQQFQLGITEDLALERCLQGLLATPDTLSEAEAQWVVCRLAELLQWPLPLWHVAGQTRALGHRHTRDGAQ